MSREVARAADERPCVSVVMAAYNAEAYLRDAIDSILRQSFADFELIVIDDGSTDTTAKILDSFQDSRIVRLANEWNVGQTRSANRGLVAARGRYVARMDADDVSEVDRLRRQVNFLDGHPGVAVVATWARFIHGEIRSADIWTASGNPGVLAWELTWRNPINNSSVLMRRDDILEVGGYDPKLRYAEDHKLWTEVVKVGKVISVLPEPLNCYRLWPDQLGVRNRTGQDREVLETAHSYVEWLLSRSVDIEQVARMIELYRGTRLERPRNAGSYIEREVEARCAGLYGGAGIGEIKDRVSDVLIFGAANALKQGRRQLARRNILRALRHNPRRAARPWTFRLLASSLVRQVS